MRGRRLRRTAVVALALAAAGMAARLAFDAWGRSVDSAYGAAARDEISAERARLAAVRFPPVIPGQGREEPCDFSHVNLGYLRAPRWMDVRLAAAHGPDAITPAVEATVREARPQLDALGDALRCDRIDPDWALSLAEPDWPPMTAALVVDGYLRIRDGETEPGVTRFLQGARLGANAGAAWPALAWYESAAAFTATARLMASRNDAPIDRIAAFLAVLEPVLPSNALFARHFQLAYGQAAATAYREDTVPLSAPKYDNVVGLRMLRMRAYVLLVPQSVRFEQATGDLDRLYRRVEQIPAGASPARRALEADTESLLASTTNPFFFDLAGGAVLALAVDEITGLAAFRLAQAVAQLERTRRDVGRVPASLPGEPWTHDPATDSSAFRYEPAVDGAGYRIWSEGKNGADDGGMGDDILVERRAQPR